MRLLVLFLGYLYASNLCQVFLQACSPGSVRIKDARKSTYSVKGRVEYCYNSSSGNVWSAVCLKGWDLNAGHVACRTYSSALVAGRIDPGEMYVKSELDYVVQVSCTGLEDNLSQCNPTCVAVQNSSCNSRQTAGVICQSVVPGPWFIGGVVFVGLFCLCWVCVVTGKFIESVRNDPNPNSEIHASTQQAIAAALTAQSTGNNRSPSTVSPGGSNPVPTVADEPPGQNQEHPSTPEAPPPYEGVEKVV